MSSGLIFVKTSDLEVFLAFDLPKKFTSSIGIGLTICLSNSLVLNVVFLSETISFPNLSKLPAKTNKLGIIKINKIAVITIGIFLFNFIECVLYLFFLICVTLYRYDMSDTIIVNML